MVVVLRLCVFPNELAHFTCRRFYRSSILLFAADSTVY